MLVIQPRVVDHVFLVDGVPPVLGGLCESKSVNRRAEPGHEHEGHEARTRSVLHLLLSSCFVRCETRFGKYGVEDKSCIQFAFATVQEFHDLPQDAVFTVSPWVVEFPICSKVVEDDNAGGFSHIVEFVVNAVVGVPQGVVDEHVCCLVAVAFGRRSVAQVQFHDHWKRVNQGTIAVRLESWVSRHHGATADVVSEHPAYVGLC